MGLATMNSFVHVVMYAYYLTRVRVRVRVRARARARLRVRVRARARLPRQCTEGARPRRLHGGALPGE